MGNQCFTKDIARPQSKNGHYLHVKIQTWRFSMLPDFKHNSHSEKIEYFCNKKCNQMTYTGFIAFDAQKQISIDTTLAKQKKQYPMLIEIQKKKQQNKFILKPSRNTIYLRIKEKSQVRLNQSFVLGSTQYKFVKLVKNQNYMKKDIKSLTLLEQKIRQIKSQQLITSLTSILSSQPTCRICMQKQQNKQNPLVSPCDCTGSLQYIHLDCWMEWAFKNSSKKENYFITHVQREKCQLCKKSLLQSEMYRQAVGTILSNHSKIQVPFIILQGQCPDKKNNYVLFKFNYIVISFKDKKSFSIGRSKKQDICLSMDYSMSRKNAKISLQEEDQIYVQDCNSKHGLYLKPESEILVCSDKQPEVYRFQNSLLTFSAHKR